MAGPLNLPFSKGEAIGIRPLKSNIRLFFGRQGGIVKLGFATCLTVLFSPLLFKEGLGGV